MRDHLTGPVLAALQNWDPVIGLASWLAGWLVAGSYQGCSEALHSLAREAAEASEGAQRVAADGGAERARGAGGLHARRAPPLGQRDLSPGSTLRHQIPTLPRHYPDTTPTPRHSDTSVNRQIST